MTLGPTANGLKLRVERAGRAALEHRLLSAGFQVAEPTYDAGVDLIVFTERPFVAYPVQIKAAIKDDVAIDRKYGERGVYMAYIFGALSEHPRIAVLPYAEAERIIAGPHRHTASWTERGQWKTVLGPRHEEGFAPYWSPDRWFSVPQECAGASPTATKTTHL